jgi:hypothetical protein
MLFAEAPRPNVTGPPSLMPLDVLDLLPTALYRRQPG